MWSSVHGLPTVPRPHPGPLENFRGPTSMFAYSRYSKRKSRTSHARAQQASRFICVPFRPIPTSPLRRSLSPSLSLPGI